MVDWQSRLARKAAQRIIRIDRSAEGRFCMRGERKRLGRWTDLQADRVMQRCRLRCVYGRERKSLWNKPDRKSAMDNYHSEIQA
jgi:hypothetical protein